MKKRLLSYTFKWILFFLLLPQLLFAQKNITTDVLIIGAGASGTTAAIQSARMGTSTILVSENEWLGGMITSAGVSAFDGNHNMPSGIWAEFREHLYKVYGGPSKVATGWVSNTLFEPHVGDSIFKKMVTPLKKLTIFYNHQFSNAIVKSNTIKGATIFDTRTKKEITINAKIVIDATELGDVMANAKIPFDIGMEASSITKENVNVPECNHIIQDLTYVAILKDYGKNVDRTIAKPNNYDPMEFDGCCNEFCSKPEKLTSNVSAQKMLDYGKLPNGKYMINWPGKGNDIYLNIINLTPQERNEELKKAKAKTLRFLYFLQTQFGFKNLDLADDEFPTTDKLPLIPYHRESRRLQGVTRFTINHIIDPFSYEYYKTGIAVGDYPIDHHHRENTNTPKNIHFPHVPSYNIPIGSLIPKYHKGIIIAEKSISVSNVVNGTTRLQPVVMLIGQAAGTLASLAVIQKRNPIDVSIRDVQQSLLSDKTYIMPYYDVKPNHPHFEAIQKIGATGILRGVGQSYQWANRTWFYPDSTVKGNELINNLMPYKKIRITISKDVTIKEAIQVVMAMSSPKNPFKNIDEKKWQQFNLQNFDLNRKITRAELAVLLIKTINPFSNPINLKGNLFKTSTIN